MASSDPFIYFSCPLDRTPARVQLRDSLKKSLAGMNPVLGGTASRFQIYEEGLGTLEGQPVNRGFIEQMYILDHQVLHEARAALFEMTHPDPYASFMLGQLFARNAQLLQEETSPFTAAITPVLCLFNPSLAPYNLTRSSLYGLPRGRAGVDFVLYESVEQACYEATDFFSQDPRDR